MHPFLLYVITTYNMATVYPHSCCPDSSQGSRKNPYPYTYHQPPYHPEGGRGGEGGRGYEGKDCVRPPGPPPETAAEGGWEQ